MLVAIATHTYISHIYNMTLLRFVVVAAWCFVAGATAGKYSREMNDAKLASGEGKALEFRIAKLDQVWGKAIRVRIQ